MQTEYSGRGDPTRTIEFLWNIRDRGSQYPKPSLTTDEIVAAAIDGIEVLSTKTSRH
jgi:hypothetical protein